MTREPFDLEKEAEAIAIAGWHEGLESLERNIKKFGLRCFKEGWESGITADRENINKHLESLKTTPGDRDK